MEYTTKLDPNEKIRRIQDAIMKRLQLDPISGFSWRPSENDRVVIGSTLIETESMLDVPVGLVNVQMMSKKNVYFHTNIPAVALYDYENDEGKPNLTNAGIFLHPTNYPKFLSDMLTLGVPHRDFVNIYTIAHEMYHFRHSFKFPKITFRAGGDNANEFRGEKNSSPHRFELAADLFAIHYTTIHAQNTLQRNYEKHRLTNAFALLMKEKYGGKFGFKKLIHIGGEIN